MRTAAGFVFVNHETEDPAFESLASAERAALNQVDLLVVICIQSINV